MDESTVERWLPGQRVTILFPEGFGVNFPDKLVGEVVSVSVEEKPERSASTFEGYDEAGKAIVSQVVHAAQTSVELKVETRPKGDIRLVPVGAYRAGGVEVRPWTVRDGWPSMATANDRPTKAEAKARRARTAKAARGKGRAAAEED